ncbi:hypothetical protein ER308_12300 [Egibacter rhizosphaerae]|uniref:Uncharacterized protein n=1 Tax=Egibacter rhizosphaerae TaxID=1670831 RepID=A0A411YGA8_9ACTN|nr:phosphotransferase [Egibacter rhizosphaerae]QBI20270.1 hypothetical protein ER308_12300 [Egibacter rhizosphaerae]
MPGDAVAAGAARLLDRLWESASSAPRVSAHEVVDLSRVRGPTVRLPLAEASWQQYERALRRVAVPRTSAHGDLRQENLAQRRDGSFAIIDWESYEPVSSLAFDLLHFHLESQRRLGAPHWGVLVEHGLRLPPVTLLAQRLGVCPPDLLAAYSVNRAARTMRLFSGPEAAVPEARRQRTTEILESLTAVLAV